MNKDEFEFLTQTWIGIKGAAYNATFEFCRQFGWCSGFDQEGRPIITKKGAHAIRDFKDRIDVV